MTITETHVKTVAEYKHIKAKSRIHVLFVYKLDYECQSKHYND